MIVPTRRRYPLRAVTHRPGHFVRIEVPAPSREEARESPEIAGTVEWYEPDSVN